MEFSNHMDKIELAKIRQITEKAAQLESEGKRVVRLQTGEPDFSAPPNVIEATIDSLRRVDTHYTHNLGILSLRQAISEKLWNDNGIKADPLKNIMVLNGCIEALYCVVTGLLDIGDELIYFEPAWIAYPQFSRFAGAVPVVVRAKEENNWIPTLEEIKKAVTDKTKMMILNSPNNPTGAVYPKELLEGIAELAKKHGFFVVSDEVYEKLIFNKAEHFSIASIEGMEELAITVNGLSKAYAMTGYRLGYVATCPELLLPILKVHQYTTACLPAFVQAGGVEALRNTDYAVREMVTEYEKRKDLIADHLEETPGISVVRPQGTFYIYPNISASGLNSTEFITKLLEEEGVAAIAGVAFDAQGEEHIRLSFASDMESLKLGAEKIAEMMRKCLK